MSNLTRAAILALLCSTLVGAASAADDYSVTVDGPIIGSTISRNRVSLGVAVNIDSTWDALSEQDKLAWRQFTELSDPRITPPFPLPNIRAFLRKLSTPERFRTTERLYREDSVLLIVRLTSDGVVDRVEVASGTKTESKELTQAEGVLVYVYGNALLTTKFSPAKMDGKPAPSAFPLRVHQVTEMR